MTKEPSSQSISISGSNISNNQVGIGETVNQNQYISDSSSQVLSREELVYLLSQLSGLVETSSLSRSRQEKALNYLEVARVEALSEEPDRQFAANSLQKFSGILKEADETIQAGQNILEKAKPILERLLPWLGVAINFLV